MKAIMVMYDTLIRKYLPAYGSNLDLPNFKRLESQTVCFDNNYTCSLPCMPARRELHTGRSNFLHRSWGPLEPFDDSMPEILKNNGIHSHLASDHQHYWEDGGASYHTRYSTWEAIRGQEGDPWFGDLDPTIEPIPAFGLAKSTQFVQNLRRQDAVNRKYTPDEKDYPQSRTFKNGLDFIDRNYKFDNWFLQIETFDPHEPFRVPSGYLDSICENPEMAKYDWPPYGPCEESTELIESIRNKYKALLKMCDKYLGLILDKMDQYNLWDDTLLIVNTDHGFLLGEHGWWSKSVMPMYEDLCHTPLYIWDPRLGLKGIHRDALVQTVDLAPTILDYFKLDIPKDMLGKPLHNTIRNNEKIRDFAITGYHGGAVNITDGRYFYMRGPAEETNSPVYEYTVMPAHMREPFTVEELRTAEIHPGFSFTKKCPVLKIESEIGMRQFSNWYKYGNALYDLETDPSQETPIDNPEQELHMMKALVDILHEHEAPEEQFTRLGLSQDKEKMTLETLAEEKKQRKLPVPEGFEELNWTWSSAIQFDFLRNYCKKQKIYSLEETFRHEVTEQKLSNITSEFILSFAEKYYAKESNDLIEILIMAGRVR